MDSRSHIDPCLMQSDREIISNCNLKEGHEHPNPSQAAGTRYPHELVSNIFDSSSMRNYACAKEKYLGAPRNFVTGHRRNAKVFSGKWLKIVRVWGSTWSDQGGIIYNIYLREIESDGLLALVWWTSNPCLPVSCLCMSPQVQLC